MEEALRFFRAYEFWIYILLALGGLIYIRKFILAWEELRGAAFGLEREAAQLAVAMGGEGAGCRGEVRERSQGVVSIPMPGGVESLNVGVAGAILLYELSREMRA